MQLCEFQFLRAGNRFDSVSGAYLGFSGSHLLSTSINQRQLRQWLDALPAVIRFSASETAAPLPLSLARLLLALTENARLHPANARLLQQEQEILRFWLPVDHRGAAAAAARLSAHILAAVRAGRPADATTFELWSGLRAGFWNQTHAHLARAAQQLAVPFDRLELNGQQFLQLGQGARLRLCRETLTDRTPLFARAATNKEGLHNLLRRRGVPLPAQTAVESLEDALEAAERIGWPVVLKPASGGKGQGVWVGLSGAEELRQAWQSQGEQRRARQLVQRMLSGADHRLLVINGVLLAAAQRRPAELCSDGVHPLHRQIAALNADPERGIGYERLKNRVPLDGRLALLLQEQGLTMDSVPPAGQTVRLSRTANISQGGSAIDCSHHVHPDNRRLAEDIARLIGSDVLGLDLISRDIGVSWREGGTWLLEANLSPGLRPHLVADPQTDLCRRIVRQWIGEGPRAGRIPTALITGSVGKTTTARLLAHLLAHSDLRVALSSTMGVELDGRRIAQGDAAGGGSALHLLQDRRVEALVAEIARGGLVRAGLGIQDADVAAVLNVLDNHIGTEGIQSRQDLARVKALVAVPAKNLLVLNADDPLVLAIAGDRDPARLALVSAEPGCAAWQAHRRAGHRAALYGCGRDARIRFYQGDHEQLCVALRDIPASHDGLADPIAPAAAFSAALASGLDLTPAQIRAGLLAFGRAALHVDGRFEPVIQEPWQVVLSWASSPEAMASLSRYALAATEGGDSRRLLLFSAPDLRPDAFIRKVGEQTWGFDLVICTAFEEERPPDEMPRLLAEGVRQIGADGPQILMATTEEEAVALLAQQIRPGDFCLVSSYMTVTMRGWLRQALTAPGP